MKTIVKSCLIIIQLLCFNSFAQKDRIYTSIAEGISISPDSVYRLDLSKQKLISIPDELFKFKNLVELNLEKNKLTELPSNFIFENMEVLNLGKNDLEVFPEVICQNISLKQLLMGKNKISIIPECIGELQELVIFDIWFNPITELPESMVKLKKLKFLDLRGMNFSPDFQKKWSALLPWAKIEFDLGCDCGY